MSKFTKLQRQVLDISSVKPETLHDTAREIAIDMLLDANSKSLPSIRTDKPFMELCIAGQEPFERIDDYVTFWFVKNPKTSQPLSLQDFLGMTGIEYNYWLKGQDDKLQRLIKAHASIE